MSKRNELPNGPNLSKNEDGEVQGLVEIDLRQNNIGVDGGLALAKVLTQNCSTIKNVRLGRVSVSNTKLSMLDFKNDVKTEIDVSNRDFHNGEANFLMHCLAFFNVKNLLTLRLSNNWLTSIPHDVLGHFKCLEMLDVSFNNIQKLPTSIKELRNTLKYIRRGGNLNMVEPPIDLGDDLGKILEYFDMKEQYEMLSKVEKNNKIDANGDVVELSQLARTVLLHIDTTLRQKSMRALDLFHSIDVDKGETIDLREFDAGLEKMGLHMNKAQVESIFTEFDDNRNGTIDIQEFNKALRLVRRLKAAGFKIDGLEEFGIKLTRPKPIPAFKTRNTLIKPGRNMAHKPCQNLTNNPAISCHSPRKPLSTLKRTKYGQGLVGKGESATSSQHLAPQPQTQYESNSCKSKEDELLGPTLALSTRNPVNPKEKRSSNKSAALRPPDGETRVKQNSSNILPRILGR